MASAPSFNTLISAASLRAQRDRGALWVVLDASFDLTDPAAGERAYQEAHLPGAVYVHLDRDLCGLKTGRNGRHPLPDRAAFAATLGRLGITPATQVVVYDRQGAMFAARVWWMLRWLGHAPVAVLDGGWPAWQAAGGAVDSGVVTAPQQPAYPLADAPALQVRTIDADALLRQLDSVTLIDARAPERYRGEVEPLDAQAGHIPGARNRPFKDNLSADGCFKPAEVLRAELLALTGGRSGTEVVHQCGSGVTACHNLLAAAVAGLEDATLYAGSWSEWSADPSRPVSRG